MDRKKKDKTIAIFSSRKGGVGKTTLGLIAALRGAERRGDVVWFVDGDLLGTEAADLFKTPENGSTKPPRLGLADLLLASAGGNLDFRELLKREMDPGRAGMTFVKIGDRKDMGVRILRSHAVPDGARRLDEGRENHLGEILALDDFAQVHLIRRLGQILGHILEAEKASLIVVDNSPLRLGVGRAFEDLARHFGQKDGPGHMKPHRSLPEDDDLTKALFKTRWVWVNVAGPDPQDVARFLEDRDECREAVKQQKTPDAPERRWIINKVLEEDLDGSDAPIVIGDRFPETLGEDLLYFPSNQDLSAGLTLARKYRAVSFDASVSILRHAIRPRALDASEVILGADRGGCVRFLVSDQGWIRESGDLCTLLLGKPVPVDEP